MPLKVNKVCISFELAVKVFLTKWKWIKFNKVVKILNSVIQSKFFIFDVSVIILLHLVPLPLTFVKTEIYNGVMDNSL